MPSRPRQAEVEDHHVGLVGDECSERGRPVTRLDHHVAGLLEDAAHEQAIPVIVLHNENLRADSLHDLPA